MTKKQALKNIIPSLEGRGEKKYTSQHLIKDRGVERRKEHCYSDSD